MVFYIYTWAWNRPISCSYFCFNTTIFVSFYYKIFKILAFRCETVSRQYAKEYWLFAYYHNFDVLLQSQIISTFLSWENSFHHIYLSFMWLNCNLHAGASSKYRHSAFFIYLRKASTKFKVRQKCTKDTPYHHP